MSFGGILAYNGWMNVTILGAGRFGMALSKVLSDNGNTVKYFDPKENGLTLEGALEGTGAAVMAVPSEFAMEAAMGLPEWVRKVPLILATKGLMDPGMFAEFEKFIVISGPAFADDILAGAKCTLTATAELGRELFENEQVTIELTNDISGVMLCGALKNIYAIGAGMLPEYDSTSAEYIERAHVEMGRYLVEHGAEAETAELACGIGDLILTCSGEQSRNFRCGRMLAEGVGLDEILKELGTVEGLGALERVDREGYGVIGEIYEKVFG